MPCSSFHAGSPRARSPRRISETTGRTGLVLLLTLALGCAERERPADKAAAPAAPSVKAPPTAASARPAAVDAAPLRASAEALVQRWSQAQNEQDFAAYEALYATRFEGIKRVGAKSFRFDRQGWMRDRKPMFRSPIKVDVSELKLQPGSSSVVAWFRQTWAGGRFRDVGEKQLVLVREGDGLKIAREEMLSSSVALSPPVRALGREDFLFVKQFGKRSFAVLERQHRGLGAGPAELVDYHAAVRSVDEQQLDLETQALFRRKFALYGAKGKLCEAKLGAARVLAHVIPHFGQVQTWQAEHGEPKPTHHAVAEEIWALADAPGGRMLVAELWAEGCDGALWARAADLPSPAVHLPVEAEPKLADEALERFRRLPGYRRLQSEFSREFAGKGPWDADERTARQVLTFAEPGSEQRYVAVTAYAPGCGDFYGELWAIWRRVENTWELLTDRSSNGPRVVPLGVFDANADGTPEVLGDGQLLEGAAGRLVRADSVRPPDFDCGC